MFLGLDLGTSGVKAVLLSAKGELVAAADAGLVTQQPQPGWSEQHPADWWVAVERTVAQLRKEHPDAWRQVRAIGLSGQMHGAVLLDTEMQCLRPAILWNDGRATAECAVLEQAVPQSRQITGNLAMAGFTAPKLLWLRTHEPSLFAQVHKVLLPKDWLRLQLIGEAVSDMSDASGTLWLDVAKREWSEPMLAACGLDLAHMPSLVEGSAVSGVLRPALAEAWGLPPHVVVAGGAGDNAASAIGVGATQPNQGFVSLGTSGVIFLVGAEHRSAPDLAVHAFCHALPKMWHQMTVMLSAASAFGWITRLTGSASESALSQHVHALSRERRQRAPMFLPYLQGERTPHNNPTASGLFAGLRAEHTAHDVAYAVMEGVAFGLLDGWRAMGNPARSTTPLALVGGGARSDAWAQLVSDTLGCPLHRPNSAHAAGALGAARLAWIADGGGVEEVCSAPPLERAFLPSESTRAYLTPRYARFQALYPAMAPWMQGESCSERKDA